MVHILEKWCPISDSNQGHTDFQSVALPTELIGHSARPVRSIAGSSAYRGAGAALSSPKSHGWKFIEQPQSRDWKFIEQPQSRDWKFIEQAET